MKNEKKQWVLVLTNFTGANWEYGEKPPFWHEESDANGKCWFIVFSLSYISEYQDDLLRMLNKLSLIEYGTYYEDLSMIRIKNVR